MKNLLRSLLIDFFYLLFPPEYNDKDEIISEPPTNGDLIGFCVCLCLLIFFISIAAAMGVH